MLSAMENTENKRNRKKRLPPCYVVSTKVMVMDPNDNPDSIPGNISTSLFATKPRSQQEYSRRTRGFAPHRQRSLVREAD
jgi:hypothetical protein